ncbi:hypothetical protein Tco_0833914 [Tanacetum coccineum]
MAEIGCNWARIGPSKSSQSLSIAHKWAVECIGSPTWTCDVRRVRGELLEAYERGFGRKRSKGRSIKKQSCFRRIDEPRRESSNDDWSHYSPIDEWEDYEHDANIESNVNNHYFDISRLFNDHTTKNDDNDVQDKMELNKDKDDDVGYLDDYLFHGNAPFIINEEEERSKERRCKLLGIPFTKPPACKMERFEVVKYSFGPLEKYVAIKECVYYDWMTTEENACHAYQDIFYKMDEGWFVTRAE